MEVLGVDRGVWDGECVSRGLSSCASVCERLENETGLSCCRDWMAGDLLEVIPVLVIGEGGKVPLDLVVIA